MYEAHAWFSLAETPSESDVGGLASAVADLKELLAAFASPTGAARMDRLNGTVIVSIAINANRRRTEATQLDAVIVFLRQRLPGSWGLVYDRDDEMPPPYGPSEFRVRRFARGQVDDHVDPFLSPFHPTIED